jgi:hypothetical protein
MPSDLGDFQESVSEVVNKVNQDTPRRVREESGLRHLQGNRGAHAEHLHINLKWFIVLFKSFYDYGIPSISTVCHQLCQVGSGHRSLENKTAVAHTNSYIANFSPVSFSSQPAGQQTRLSCPSANFVCNRYSFFGKYLASLTQDGCRNSDRSSHKLSVIVVRF